MRVAGQGMDRLQVPRPRKGDLGILFFLIAPGWLAQNGTKPDKTQTDFQTKSAGDSLPDGKKIPVSVEFPPGGKDPARTVGGQLRPVW